MSEQPRGSAGPKLPEKEISYLHALLLLPEAPKSWGKGEGGVEGECQAHRETREEMGLTQAADQELLWNF